MFRQTQTEHDHNVSEGVTIVESEIASLLAARSARDVAGGVVVIVSGNPDANGEPVDWKTISDTQRQAFGAVIAALG